MQVNVPDFFAPSGAKSSTQAAERPGDGGFDALLREQQARYDQDPPPAHEPSDATRRADDDYARGAPLRKERAKHDPERPADDQEVSEPTPAKQADAGDKHVQKKHEQKTDDQATASQDGDTPKQTAAADKSKHSGKADKKAKPDSTAASAAVLADGGLVPPVKTGQGPSTPPTAAAAQVAEAATAPVPADGKANTTGANTTGAKAAGATAAAATPAAAAKPDAAETATAAAPASGAAPAQRAADKAAQTATDKTPNQTAATHRQAQTPPTAPADAAKQPGQTTSEAAKGADQATATTTTAALDSRPSATLGGAAATAAMAQEGKGKSPETAKPDGKAASQDSDLQVADDKPAKPSAQTAKGPQVAATAKADKSAQAGPAPTSDGGGGDAPATGPGAGAGQPAGTTPVAANGVAGTGTAHNTSFTQALANARHAPSANPAEQVAVQIHRAQVAGQEHTSIKLHPADLGHIHVKLESSSDGTLRAVISADRSDTLHMLQRDARGLERALQDAGVKTDSGSLNFNLRGQGQGYQQQAGDHGTAGRPAFSGREPASIESELMATLPPAARASHDGALDIRV